MKIELDITDGDVAALKHDLADVEAWLRAAITGKADNCRKRMAAEGLSFARSGKIDVKTLADISDVSLADALVKHPDYKDRAARDAGERTGVSASDVRA